MDAQGRVDRPHDRRRRRGRPARRGRQRRPREGDALLRAGSRVGERSHPQAEGTRRARETPARLLRGDGQVRRAHEARARGAHIRADGAGDARGEAQGAGAEEVREAGAGGEAQGAHAQEEGVHQEPGQVEEATEAEQLLGGGCKGAGGLRGWVQEQGFAQGKEAVHAGDSAEAGVQKRKVWVWRPQEAQEAERQGERTGHEQLQAFELRQGFQGWQGLGLPRQQGKRRTRRPRRWTVPRRRRRRTRSQMSVSQIL
mmetsp:Transcript_144/g.536  ORF Transcript_144/g.536 Transcript_144/m.536 type:complete len:256 (+) Transcript_144:333-1100(+)